MRRPTDWPSDSHEPTLTFAPSCIPRWYLSDPDWPAPNLPLLNNALRQTGWEAEPLTGDNWRQAVRRRPKAVAWEQVVDDVRPFLDSSGDAGLLTAENLKHVLDQRPERRQIKTGRGG
jgi:hypothetical protein